MFQRIDYRSGIAKLLYIDKNSLEIVAIFYIFSYINKFIFYFLFSIVEVPNSERISCRDSSLGSDLGSTPGGGKLNVCPPGCSPEGYSRDDPGQVYLKFISFYIRKNNKNTLDSQCCNFVYY